MEKKIELIIRKEEGEVGVEFGDGTSDNVTTADAFSAIVFLNSVIYESVRGDSNDPEAAFERVQKLNELALQSIQEKSDANEKEET